MNKRQRLRSTKLLQWCIRKNPLRRIRKLRTQFLIVLVCAGVLSVLTWNVIWHAQPKVWQIVKHMPGMLPDHDALIEELKERAIRYTVPESEDDPEAIEQMQPFFEGVDNYTSVNIYGKDGYYRIGYTADLVYNRTWQLFSNMVFQITYATYDNVYHEPDNLSENFCAAVEFANGEYDVYFTFFHNSRITVPYFIFSLSAAIFLFLLITLLFIRKKIGHVLDLKEEILLMSGGDLSRPVPDFGADEIGVLSRELDKLRIALNENMQQEAESRKANQDLITAMSHDLRTPLTILNGYLEVMKLKRNPQMQEEYLERCLNKTNDIRQMTDRMFEYALVFEKTENIILTELPISLIQECLTEHMDFLRLAGFKVESSLCEPIGFIAGDETTLKRIFQNLFSNILKYGDKKDIVLVSCHVEQKNLKISLANSVKNDLAGIESSHVGLKSVKKMLELHNGSLFISDQGGAYIAETSFPVF